MFPQRPRSLAQEGFAELRSKLASDLLAKYGLEDADYKATEVEDGEGDGEAGEVGTEAEATSSVRAPRPHVHPPPPRSRAPTCMRAQHVDSILRRMEALDRASAAVGGGRGDDEEARSDDSPDPRLEAGM